MPGPIPGQHISSAPQQDRRDTLAQRMQQREHMGAGLLLIRHLQPRQGGTAGEVVQVRRLGIVEMKDPSQGIKHLGGDATRLPLLEPGVVARTQPGQLGQLLTPQPRDASRRSVRAQTEGLRGHPVSTSPQERSQRLAGDPRRGHHCLHAASPSSPLAGTPRPMSFSG